MLGFICLEVRGRSVPRQQIVIQQMQYNSILHSIKFTLVCILFDISREVNGEHTVSTR